MKVNIPYMDVLGIENFTGSGLAGGYRSRSLMESEHSQINYNQINTTGISQRHYCIPTLVGPQKSELDWIFIQFFAKLAANHIFGTPKVSRKFWRKKINGWWFQPMLKNISQNGSFPQVGVKIKNI